MIHCPRRRKLLLTALSACGAAYWPLNVLAVDDTAPSPPLATLIRHPLLTGSLYTKSVSSSYDASGAAGANLNGYRWIEEQRQGAEWIVRGIATGKSDWVARGWQQLDWGIARQQPDGGFASEDPFHSTSFFVEALARSCQIDSTGASSARIAALHAAAAWLKHPANEGPGAKRNQPYTHRRYILAAAFGQTAAVTGDAEFASHAQSWAQQGIALQDSNGVNPERGGLDAGYQMVGVLMALRYLPVCDLAALRAQLRGMMRRAVARELALCGPDGTISADGSTRIGKENSRSGKLKTVPYGEILQALVFGAQSVPQPEWLEPAHKIALLNHWTKY